MTSPSTPAVVPRWEWRTFARRATSADAGFDAMVPWSLEESDEIYLLASGGDNVKVRDELVDVIRGAVLAA